MKNDNIVETKSNGFYEINIYPYQDILGLFLNIFRRQNEIFKPGSGDRTISEVNIGKTHKKGTIRGLYQ